MSDNLSVRTDDQGVAEKSGPAELFHQGHGKLREGVADNDSLCYASQLIEELKRAGQRIDLCDRLLNLGKSKAVLTKDAPAECHQFFIIRFIAGRSCEFRDSCHL